ncbi:MAG: flavodoxin domain-containing protein [Angelakisella sp.]
MTTQLLYASMSGHSKKIAQAIAEKTGVPMHNLKTQPTIPPCDTLFIVSGIYGGESSPELLEYAKKMPENQAKHIVLITSSTRGTAQGTLRKTLTEAGHRVETQEYLCTGGFLFMAFGHPNRSEIDGAVSFAEKLMEKLEIGG